MTSAEERIKEAMDRRKKRAREKMCYHSLIENIQKWGEEKEITDPRNLLVQYQKFREEADELGFELTAYTLAHNADELLKKSLQYDEPRDEAIEAYHNTKMEMGDVLVTLSILAKQLDVTLYECMEMAYEKIKGRKGKTINGTFVKEEDLNATS